MEWILDGIGTELISLVIGTITGGCVGYRIAIKNTQKNTQNAGNNSVQIQGGINVK